MKIEDNGDKPKRSTTGDGSYNDARAREADIDERSVYRIACVGFSNEAGDLDSALRRVFARCFDDHDGPRLALLPGVVTEADGWPHDDHHIRSLAQQHVVSVLAEANIGARGAHYRAYDTNGAPLPVAIFQRFAYSVQADTDRVLVDDLLAECRLGGERTIDLAGVPVGLLVCGENNLLANVQSQGNRAYVRHHLDAGDVPVFDRVPVIFNGSHTTMGNWGKLAHRFEYLSRGRRWAFYATNCDRWSWGESTLRVYFDGKLLATSNLRSDATHDGARIRVITDEVDDLCLALVADIPGHLLTPAASR